MMTTRPWWSQLPGTNLRNEYNLQTEAQMSLTQPQQFIHITCVNFIHGDLGGKVNIFGGHSTGHCGGGRRSYEHVSNSNGYRDRAV
jgi:hypothetical protein